MSRTRRTELPTAQRVDYRTAASPTRTPRRRRATRWWWSAPARWACALAIDLAQRGVPVVLLDNDDTLSTGSRAICFAKRTLEIFDRLGCGDRMVAKGVSWNVGKVFFQRRAGLPLRPAARGRPRAAGVHQPAAVLRRGLPGRTRRAAAADRPALEEQGGRRRAARRPRAADRSRRPTATTRSTADYVVACDGCALQPCASCSARRAKGRVFRDRFLIADVRDGRSTCPAERWFWFDPPFHPQPERAAAPAARRRLAHRLPARLGRRSRARRRSPRSIIPRVQGAARAASALRTPSSTLEWASVYTFACLRMERFRHGRVLFAGDSAHGVSPFGARGANSGVQDADNLGLEAGRRAAAARRPTRCSTATPASANTRPTRTSATPRAPPTSSRPRARSAGCSATPCSSWPRTQPFARTLVNSGRLSVPATLHGSPLNTPDADAFAGRMVPGRRRRRRADACVPTAARGWLLRELRRRLHRAGLRRRRRGRAQRCAAVAEADAARCTVPAHRRAVGDADELAARALRRASRARVLPAAPRPARLRALAPARAPQALRAALRPRAGQGDHEDDAMPTDHRPPTSSRPTISTKR